MISRRATAFGISIAAAACATRPTREPPFLGGWRDVSLRDIYVFHPNGQVDYTPAPVSNPDFEPTVSTYRYWRLRADGRYEVIERFLTFDAQGEIASVGRLSFDGARLVLRFRQSWRNRVLERTD